MSFELRTLESVRILVILFFSASNPHSPQNTGTKQASLPQDIILEDNDNDILPEHCVFVVETNRVTAFSAPDACTFVDDEKITDSLEPTALSDGMMIRFGNTKNAYVFQFVVRECTESPKQEEQDEKEEEDELSTKQQEEQQQKEEEQRQKDEELEMLRSSYVVLSFTSSLTILYTNTRTSTDTKIFKYDFETCHKNTPPQRHVRISCLNPERTMLHDITETNSHSFENMQNVKWRSFRVNL